MGLRSKFILACVWSLAWTALPAVIQRPVAIVSGSDGGVLPSTAYVNPYAYYRADETNHLFFGLPASDRFFDVTAGGNHLFAGGTNYAVLDTGQITNSYAIDNSFNYAFGGGSGLRFGANRWCIRFWIKASNNFVVGPTILSLSADGGTEIHLGAPPLSPTNNAILVYAQGTNWTTTNRVAPSGSIYHRVVIWRDRHESRIKIDNDSTETFAIPVPLSDDAFASAFLVKLHGEPADPYGYKVCAFDELSIWFKEIPNEADMLYDWNSGAGRTYPLQ